MPDKRMVQAERMDDSLSELLCRFSVQPRMQGADKVNSELEVGFDQRFERRWVRAEQAGRIIMVLVVAAGLAGLMGRGPYSHQTERSAASHLAVDFEPIAQSQTATQVTIHLNNPIPDPALDMFVSSNAVEPMGLGRITPQPVAMRAVENGMLLTMAVPPRAADVVMLLMLMPAALGSHELMARLNGYPALHWTQLVVP